MVAGLTVPGEFSDILSLRSYVPNVCIGSSKSRYLGARLVGIDLIGRKCIHQGERRPGSRRKQQ